MLPTTTPRGGRRIRLHRRLAGVAALTATFLSLFGASAVASDRRVDRALDAVTRDIELRADAKHLQARFADASHEVHLILDSLPLDVASLQASPASTTCRTAATAPLS